VLGHKPRVHAGLPLVPPHPRKCSFKLTIPSTLSSIPGSISLYFYTPPSYNRPSSESPSLNNLQNKTKDHLFPVIINFHGGGWTIGSPQDDARWAAHCTSALAAVVISADYRLAALHPFPTAIEDRASTILWVKQHGPSHNLDPSRIALSGFSAGGSLCFTSQYSLHDKLAERNEPLPPTVESSAQQASTPPSTTPSRAPLKTQRTPQPPRKKASCAS